MRQIVKVNSEYFTQKTRKYKPKNWEETHPFRSELRDLMLKNDQNDQCAYTELYLKDSTSINCHIDHFKKRTLFPKLFDDYNNLFVASNEETYGAKYKDNIISDKTANEGLLSPTTPDLHIYFEYDRKTGEIRGLNKKATDTVSAFNLNHPFLVQRRMRIIENVTSYKDQDITMDEAVASTRGFENLIRYIYNVNNN